MSSEIELRVKAERSAITYRQISRTYWERWRWELHKRREALKELMVKNRFTPSASGSRDFLMHEIDPSMLRDPLIGGKQEESFVARGSFGIVRLQEYRNIQVAVKEFLPRSLLVDVKAEASILSSLSHPYVPFLLGIVTKKYPLRIVMQFHSVCDQEVTTFEREIRLCRFFGIIWITLCAQLIEAVHYLHEEVGILHNDIKGDNILLAQTLKPEEECQCQVVLIDYGKSTTIADSRRYDLTAYERSEYVRRYPHIPPEVIEGEQKQSKGSDIYAIGRVMHQISDSNLINSLEKSQKGLFKMFAEKCRNTDYSKRPKIKECLDFFKQL